MQSILYRIALLFTTLLSLSFNMSKIVFEMYYLFIYYLLFPLHNGFANWTTNISKCWFI